VTECYQNALKLPSVKRCNVEITFDGGEVTSDAGIQLLRLVDQKFNLTAPLANLLSVGLRPYRPNPTYRANNRSQAS
jgi:hypothetical protein